MEFKIILNNIRFYSFNGCLTEEASIGTEYILNIEVTTQNTSYIKDDLSATVDYSEVYKIAEEEIQKRYNLIETLAHKILIRLKQVKSVQACKIEVKKINPPINGDVESVSVIFAA